MSGRLGRSGRQAVILAGGLATRMRPRTLTTPKSMLEVAGRPFVDLQLQKLLDDGYDDVVMCVAHLGEQIRARVGGEFRGMRVRYSDEGPSLRGTAGALRVALPLLAPTFLVTYGDSYLPFDYAGPLDALRAHDDCDGVMAVFKNEGKWDASNVVMGGPRRREAGCDDERDEHPWVLRYEKGATGAEFDHIDYGATALRREIVANVPEDAVLGFDVVQRSLAEKKRLRGFVAHARFFEIGSPEGLAELERHLTANLTMTP
jgi:N-acetyl-alpha-D-muramate 1-phosphate uridylyltransferase